MTRTNGLRAGLMNMKDIVLLPGLALITALMIAPKVHAADNRIGLIIAISDYGNPDVPRLEGVPYDVQSARRIAKEMSIPEKNIVFLKDENASKANIIATIRKMGESAEPGTRAFVYFSGHGTRYYSQDAGGCVEGLLAYDQQAITNEELAKASQTLFDRSDKVITMIDACHSEGVVPPKRRTRALGNDANANAKAVFTSKVFLSKTGIGQEQCQRVANQRTRSLFSTSTALGALKENVVQITSSRPDEVSFDEPGRGGLATQAVRDCLLGDASDINGSGGISLEEIQICAQKQIDAKLAGIEGLLPHHVTVSGNRNLIVSTPSTATVTTATPAVQTAAQAASQPVAQAPALASLATLTDIHQQRDPRRSVEVKMPRDTLKIGADALDLTVTSSHDGFVYLVLLGSDAKSFYLLFPNGLDADNRISAKTPLRLPRPNWAIKAGGPAGIDQMMVLVTDTPRDLSKVQMANPSASEPFTYALNDFSGRANLINFLVGRGRSSGSESFGSSLVQIKEVE